MVFKRKKLYKTRLKIQKNSILCVFWQQSRGYINILCGLSLQNGVYVHNHYRDEILLCVYCFFIDFWRIFGLKRVKMVKNGKVGFISGYLFVFFCIYAYMRSNFDERLLCYVILFIDFYTKTTKNISEIVKSTKNKNS